MIHPIDLLANVPLRMLRGRRRTFHEGWGDDTLHAFNDAANFRPDEVGGIQIEWGPTQTRNGLWVTDGTFESPATMLPPASATAVVRKISPPGPVRAWSVWMASWNDQSWDTRTSFATRLAGDDIGSVLLMNPYYGPRRPGSRNGQPIATVADFGIMGRAAVIEGVAVLRALAADGTPVGVAGYSMGANIGAMVSAATDFPVATAALAVSHSPAPVFLAGPPGRAVAWDALGGRDHAVPAVARIIGSASVLRMPPPPHADAAVLVGSRRDGFVPASATAALHRHWPGSELRWLGGGHATMLWLAKEQLVDAVRRAFIRLERRRSSEPLEP